MTGDTRRRFKRWFWRRLLVAILLMIWFFAVGLFLRADAWGEA